MFRRPSRSCFAASIWARSATKIDYFFSIRPVSSPDRPSRETSHREVSEPAAVRSFARSYGCGDRHRDLQALPGRILPARAASRHQHHAAWLRRARGRVHHTQAAPHQARCPPACWKQNLASRSPSCPQHHRPRGHEPRLNPQTINSSLTSQSQNPPDPKPSPPPLACRSSLDHDTPHAPTRPNNGG